MRVIKGIYKNKSIVHKGIRARPLTQASRRLIFDTLDNITDIKDKVIYDVCAGSGSFGIEALSRGAKSVYFIEKCARTAKELRLLIQQFNIHCLKIINADVLYCPTLHVAPNIIFIDPPFGHMLCTRILDVILAKQIISTQTIFIVRSDYDFDIPSQLKVIICKQTRHGMLRFMKI